MCPLEILTKLYYSLLSEYYEFLLYVDERFRSPYLIQRHYQLTLPCCTWWCNYSSLLGIFLLCILYTTPWFILLSLCLFSRVYSIIPQYELTTFYDLLLFCVWFYTIEKDKYVFLVSGSYFTECFPLHLLVFLISGVLEKSCFCAQWEMYNPPLFIISFTTLAALLLQIAWSTHLCFYNMIFLIVCPAKCVFPPFLSVFNSLSFLGSFTPWNASFCYISTSPLAVASHLRGFCV